MYNKYFKKKGATLIELVMVMILSVLILMTTAATFLGMTHHFFTISDKKYANGIAEGCIEKMIGSYRINGFISSSVCDPTVGIYSINIDSGAWSDRFNRFTVTVTGGKIFSSDRSLRFILPSE